MKTRPPKIRYRVGSVWLNFRDNMFYVLDGYARRIDDPHIWILFLTERCSPDALSYDLDPMVRNPRDAILLDPIETQWSFWDKVNLAGRVPYNRFFIKIGDLEKRFKFISEGAFTKIEKELLQSLPSPISDAEIIF